MKRDMDLIRDLLLHSEEHCCGLHTKEVEISEFQGATDDEQLFAHIKMLEEVGLLGPGHHTMGSICVGNLTWQGHEFLDTVRDDEIWRRTKATAEKAKGFTVDILTEIAKGLIKTQVKKYTEVEL